MKKAKKSKLSSKNWKANKRLSKEIRPKWKLAKLHPDYHDIRGDEKFHQWVSEQDSTIQGWLYENTSNAKLAARAIDLYKVDTGK